MCELDYKESWVPKNCCFWTVVLEKTLEIPLDGKEIKPVHPKGNQSWIFIGRTDAETKTPILWPPDVKNQLIEKDPYDGKDWRQEEKGIIEDETVGWHHRWWWSWVWIGSGSWWWTGRPGMLLSMGSQRVRHDWATKLNWTESQLTCCDSFRCTAEGLSHTYICIIHPQGPLLFSLPHKVEHTSLCYTVRPSIWQN